MAKREPRLPITYRAARRNQARAMLHRARKEGVRARKEGVRAEGRRLTFRDAWEAAQNMAARHRPLPAVKSAAGGHANG